MRIRTGVISLALAAAAGAFGSALAEEVPLPALYKSLAEKNRYQVVEGLTSAQADVKCNIMETLIAAFPDAAGKPIAVKFYWQRLDPNGAPQKKFVVSGVPEALTDLSGRLAQVFNEAQDFVVPDPVYWTIANLDSKAVSEGGKVTVKGTAKSPGDPIKGIEVTIDAATHQVGRMDMDLGQAHVVMEHTSRDVGGKWAAETTSVQYPQYKKVVSYEYVQSGSFWLPSKISIAFLGQDGKELQPTFVYELSNWQANQGLPPGAF